MRAAPEPGVGRLRTRPEFLAVAAGGRRFHTGRLTAQGRLRDGGEPELRIGFTVTKREGHATERNRIRRRLRSAAADALSREGAALPLDLVLIGRRDALRADYDTLLDDLRRALGALRGGRKAPTGGGRPDAREPSPRT